MTSPIFGRRCFPSPCWPPSTWPTPSPPPPPAFTTAAPCQHLSRSRTRRTGGRGGQPPCAIPKIEADIVVDGNLDEAVWRRAAVLTGFSLYSAVVTPAASAAPGIPGED